MTREHAPRPGANWEQQTTAREVVVPDGPWGGPTTFRPWIEGTEQAAEPASNRATRRAIARATRQKGHR